ncbi:PLC-like phosphodiesterase [Glarea lozoyensis ATCC 20868]|uniref:PLC-like phosphodiesterase n=1 Tax=Glarea lozoyensis (strain ATCC 20868 / MF5171) TaxID=1116229 RepID=S3DIR6_GLAL2|nr:PLC-like phosphodiesterase [Glarea lozoyensis ATCC 20868]EPE37054.1 PLC-like phosphodiesterase [Glarea lozoyensis ATCC 20868]
MVFRQVPIALLFAIAANAQVTDIPTISDSRTTSSGSVTLSELATPTGNYLTISTTITRETSSPISTSVIVSTVSSGSSTRTTTLGSSTILGIGTLLAGSNSSTSGTSSVSSSTTDSRTFLSGAPRSSSTVTGSRNATASTSAAAQPTNMTPCNNWPEFCSRSYSNITEVAAHNSPFVKPGNAAANQALPVTTQLNDGIRLLQGQMHFVGDVPHFCHSSCDVLDAGPITDWLTEVREWVQSHPYDVVTILLGNGNYSLVDLYVPFIESTGILDYIYTPPKIPMGINDWPTLQNMIIRGQRVVMFLDYDTNQTAYPWFIDEFSSVWETAFDPTNRSFPCDVQRPPGLNGEEIQNRMYLMNHNLNYDIDLLGVNLLVPYVPLLNVTNNVTGFGSLGVTTEQCATAYGYQPKFLNVDYYNVGKGSVFEVAARHNNVTYDRACCGLASTSAGMKTTTSSLFLAVAGAVGLVLVL